MTETVNSGIFKSAYSDMSSRLHHDETLDEDVDDDWDASSVDEIIEVEQVTLNAEPHIDPKVEVMLNESSEEKKLRIKKEMEQASLQQAMELFGGECETDYEDSD